MKIAGKKLGIAASLFAASMMFCVAPADAKTIKAKSLKLTKKTVSVTVGKTVKLKSKVKVKPAKAKLKWSSNKKKIATVTSKGVVKGKKAGTAKITVKSGKKSAKFKVKVKKAPVKVAVSNVEVLTSKTVRVTLNKAQKVDASKFSIYRKADSNGTAQKKLSIAKVNNTANKTYELVLSDVLDDNDNDKNCINDGDFVQVTVAGLAGTKTKTAKYVYCATPRDNYMTGLVDERFSSSVYFGDYTTGYSSFTIGALPAGLKATVNDYSVSITGVPTGVCSDFKTVITAKDEMKKTVSITTHFYIGSENQMVGYALPKLAPAGKSVRNGNLVYVGGKASDSKTFTTTLQNALVTVDDEDGDVHLAETAPTGVYDVPVTVADKSGHAITINVQTKVVPSVLITGTVKNAAGTIVKSANVTADFTKYDPEYANSASSFDASTDENGVYKLYVPASKTYDITAYENNARKTVYNTTVGATGTVPADFVLDKLFAVTTNVTKQGYLSWKDSVSGDYFDSYNGVLNLKAGTYKLTSDEVYVTTTDAAGKTTTKKEVYTLNITVTGNTQAVVIVKSSVDVTENNKL